MAVSILIIFLFAILVVTGFWLLHFRRSNPGIDPRKIFQPFPAFPDNTTAFNRTSIRFIGVVILSVTVLLVLLAGSVNLAHHIIVEATLLIFLLITAAGYAYFLKSENKPQSWAFGNSSKTVNREKII